MKVKNQSENQAETFTERPFYQIKLKTSSVGFDIRINDFPVLQYSKGESASTEMEIPINPAILSSGTQTFSVRAFPLIGQTKISKEANLEIEINKKPDALIYDGNREIVMQGVKMDAENLPVWTFETKFEANVPYSFVAWTQSQDLNKVNNLNQLLNNAYQKISDAIEGKNDAVFREIIKEASKVDIMMYEVSNETVGFQPEPEKILPMRNCRIGLYGNNKLVRYESPELESCLKSEVIFNDNSKKIYSYPIYFHLPKGATELEVIR